MLGERRSRPEPEATVAMSVIRHFALILGVLLAVGAVAASLDVIELRYRNADELLPLITPHLTESATVTGMADKLVVRAEQTELIALRRLVAELDTPPRAVLVTVRRGSGSHAVNSGFELGSSATRGRVRIHRSESAHSDSGEQQLRGLEGRPLQITTRTLLPITDHVAWLGDGGVGSATQTQLLELDGGLYALPRLRGDMVEVDILVQDRRRDDPLSSRQVVTTVSGRAGEWIPFAAIGTATRRDSSGIVYRSDSARGQAETLWLRVVPLD